MYSDMYGFDISFHRHSSSDMFSYDESRDLLLFSDLFPFFTGSPPDIAQENSFSSLDPFSLSFLSFSPSNSHFESQSLYQDNRVQPLSNSPNLEREFTNFTALDGSELKTEECQMGVDNTYLPHSYSRGESVSKLMQRSYSCNSFDGNPGNFPIEAHRDTLMDSPNFQWHALSSPENSFFTGQIRRVFSAGDLQNMNATETSQTENTLSEEAIFKVGRYSAEERKEKISKYRAKRSQRKFNKTIKYACRKTLADNRARIRGRFARNDYTSVIPKAPCSTSEEEEHEFWIELIEGLNDEVAERYADSDGAPQFQ